VGVGARALYGLQHILVPLAKGQRHGARVGDKVCALARNEGAQIAGEIGSGISHAPQHAWPGSKGQTLKGAAQ